MSLLEPHFARLQLKLDAVLSTPCTCSGPATIVDNKNHSSCILPALGRPLRICFEHAKEEQHRWNQFLQATFDSQTHTSECIQMVGPAAEIERAWREPLAHATSRNKAWNSETMNRLKSRKCFAMLETGQLSGNEPDLIITDRRSIDTIELLENARTATTPTHRVWIIHARRSDSSSHLFQSPVWHPNLAAHFREYALRDRSLYKKIPVPVGDRYHWQLTCNYTLARQRKEHAKYRSTTEHVCDGMGDGNPMPKYDPSMLSDEQAKELLTDSDLDKVKVANFNWATYHNYLAGTRDFAGSRMMQRIFETAPHYLTVEKDLCDVFSINSPRATVDGLARQEVKERMEALNNQLKQASRWTSLLRNVGLSRETRSTSASLPPTTRICTGRVNGSVYAEWLSRAKLSVCMWGLGERTACDEMAMLAGAVLLKPDTSFVESFPDVYNPHFQLYVPIRHDLSDLESQISRVLSNYKDFAHMRYLAQQLLRSADHQQMLRHFWRTVVAQVATLTNGTFSRPEVVPLDSRRRMLLEDLKRSNG